MEVVAVSRRTLIVPALMLIVGAVGITYAGYTRAPGLRVASWIAYVLAVICAVTAARLLEVASGRAGTGNWFALVFFGGCSTVEWWITFRGDPRACTASFNFAGASSCKIGFGIAAAISTALAIYCLQRVTAST